MLVERIRLFWAKCKFVRLIVFLALLIGALFLVLLIGSRYYTESSAATKGIVGTLLGAITGGCFTLLGSLFNYKRTQKASTAIRRKNTIYKPLYDELMEIDSDILVENPYPHYVVFKIGPQTELRHPQYTVWGRITKDARYFEVPIKLRKAMEELYEAIEEYIDARKMAVSSLSRIYNEEISKLSTKPKEKWYEPGEVYLSDLIGKREMEETFVAQVIETNCNDETSSLRQVLRERGSTDTDYKKYIDARSVWDKKEKYVLKLLAYYIQYSMAKYEV